MPFTNLFRFSKSFRDHNFNVMFGYLSADTAEGIEGQFHPFFHPEGPPHWSDDFPEPYIQETLRFTLSAGCCASFFRTNPELPTVERDYYLSKLFQYIWVPLRVQFDLPVDRDDREIYFFGNNEEDPGPLIEELLDTIPNELLSLSYGFDWYDEVLLEVYQNARHHDLKTVLKGLQTRLQKIVRPKTVSHRSPRTKKGTGINRRMQLTPSQFRARLVAEVIGEIGLIRPQMLGESDYDSLEKEHNRYLIFRVTRDHEDLRTLLINVQAHRRYYRLAQQIAARHTGKALDTIINDWKKHKPREFRSQGKT